MVHIMKTITLYHLASSAWIIFIVSFSTLSTATLDHLGVHDGLHFSMEARASNLDHSLPIYKNPNASIKDRVNNLLPRMTIREKVAQLQVFLLLFSFLDS